MTTFLLGALVGATLALFAAAIRDIAQSWPSSYEDPTEAGPPLPRFSFWSTKDGRLYVWEGDTWSGLARPAEPGELVVCGFEPDAVVRQVNATADGWTA